MAQPSGVHSMQLPIVEAQAVDSGKLATALDAIRKDSESEPSKVSSDDISAIKARSQFVTLLPPCAVPTCFLRES